MRLRMIRRLPRQLNPLAMNKTQSIIFCGTECKCKNRCEGFFPHDKDLKTGCKNACRSGADIQSRDQYLLEFVGEETAIDVFNTDPDKTNDVSRCTRPGSELDPVCNPKLLEPKNYTWAYVLGGVVIVALIIVVIRKMR